MEIIVLIVWLASYPRSGNTLLRTILHNCFGIDTYSLYDDKADIGSDASFSAMVGHINHNRVQTEFYAKALESEGTYFVKTHDGPVDELAGHLHSPGWAISNSFLLPLHK